MDTQDRDWKRRFDALPRSGATGSCPRAETLSTWTRGPLSEEAVGHLAGCPSCREEIVDVRRRLAEKGQTEAPRPGAKTRLYRLMPGRRIPFGWIAAAAVLIVAILLALTLKTGEPPQPPRPVVAQPPPKEKPQPAAPPRETPPPTTTPIPEERPVVPAPAPEKPPAPPAPAPVKETPAVAKPAPEPEKPPAPVPAKPAPATTRARLKGSLLGMAGSVSTRTDTDAWQPLRIGQGRDFMGVVKLKADVAAGRLRVGAHTVSLQRGGELALTLEEGRTHVKLARGEAFFDVPPGKNAFEVETSQGLVVVKGTRFLVSAERNETEVFVQRGAVQFNTVMIAAGERSAGGAAQRADVAKRLGWLRPLEETILIEADQMALQGGMTVLPDATASAGRAIGVKGPLKAGQEAAAEIAARRKQPGPYAVWVRLHWSHGVPSALTLAAGDALTWSSRGVVASPNWQWIRVGAAEFADERFRVRLTDTQPGLRVDQILITTDSELNPDSR